MKCFTPITLQKTKVLAPCGRCYACLRNKQREWFVRLTEEAKVAKNCFFVTLTYDNEHLPIDKDGNSYVCKKDVMYFRKRLYKNMGSPSDFRYYIASEYGPKTMRPHYHAILFNVSETDIIKLHAIVRKSWSKQKQVGSKARDYFCHSRGITIDEVNNNRIGYVTGYVMESKKDLQCGKKVFSLKSKGLGKSYLHSKSRVAWHKENILEHNYYPLPDGKKMALPEYYRNKIYSEAMKEAVKQVKATETLQTIPKSGRLSDPRITTTREAHEKQNRIKAGAKRRYEKLLKNRIL